MGYSALKTALDAVVRTNGSQAITGSNLNGVLTTLLKGVDVMDRENGVDTTGMTHIVLDGSKTFAEQVTDQNTIYEIRDAFSLGGGSFTIPTGCVLDFEGGSVSNGTIHFNGCFLDGDWDAGIQCYADGNLANSVVYPEMFAPGNCADWSPVINAILADNKCIHFKGKSYSCSTSINITYSNRTLVGTEDTLLRFFGTGDFIKIGQTTDYARFITIRKMAFRKEGSGTCDNLVSFLGASEIILESIDARGNELTTNGFGRPSGAYHFISSILIKCRSWDCENGFVFQYTHQSQVNNITMIACGVGRMTHNGLVLNGNGINVVGGDYSNTGDNGILVDGYVRGMFISSTYQENNGANPISITKSDILNLEIVNPYIYSGNIVCGWNKFMQSVFNIKIGNELFKKIYNFDRINISSDGSSVEEGFHEISGTKLPCKVNVKFKTITTNSYLFTLLGIYINGKAYQLNTQCEIKKIIAKSGNTLTLDSALSADYSLRVNILQNNELLKILGESSLQTLGACLMTSDNYEYVREYYLAKSVSGATTGATSVDINDSELNVGDFIAFTNSQRGDRLNGSSISISQADHLYSQDQPLPQSVANFPKGLKEKMCVMFYVDANVKNYTLDFASAYEIS